MPRIDSDMPKNDNRQIDDAFVKQKGTFHQTFKTITIPISTDTTTTTTHANNIPQSYHFVTSQNGLSSPKAKRHVIDHVRRQRLSRKRNALRPLKKFGELQWQKRPLNSADRDGLREDRDQGSTESSYSLNSLSIDLHSPSGAGWLDPFASTPGPAGTMENKLTDHFLRNLGTNMPRHRERATLFPMKGLIFAQSMEDPAAYNALLSYSAYHLATIRGESISTRAFVYQGESVRIVNERLKDISLRSADGTIQAVILLSHIEHHFGDNHATRTHFEGLQQLVIMRGGLSAMEGSPKLQSQLYWLDFTSTRSIFTSFPRGFGASDKTEGDVRVCVTPEQLEYMRTCCETFISVLENIMNLSVIRRHSAEMLDAVNAATRPGPSRFAILGHIHSALWDYHGSPEKTRDFLVWVNDEMSENSKQTDYYIDTLLWLLVQKESGIKLERPKSTSLVRRLITIGKLLSARSAMMVERVMLSCLLEETMDIAAEASGWDPDHIRRDIMGQHFEESNNLDSASQLSRIS